LRIKEQETRLTLQEHDDDDDDVLFRMQREAVQLEGKYKTLSMDEDWNYSDLKFAIKKFQYFAHNCAEIVDVEWTMGSSDNE